MIKEIGKLLYAEVETTCQVDWHDLNNAINAFFKSKGIEHEFQVTLEHECPNDSVLKFDVKAADFKERHIEDFQEGELGFRGEDILNWMAHEGEISDGQYIIDISW